MQTANQSPGQGYALLPDFFNESYNPVTEEDGLDQIPSLDYHNIIKLVVLLTLFFLSLWGNVRSLIYARRRLRRGALTSTWNMNCFILNLSVADIMVTLFCILGDAVWNVTVQWYAGVTTCKLLMFARSVSLCSSTYIITFISLDRAVAVMSPVRSSGSVNRRAKIMLAITWVFSVIMGLPQLAFFQVQRGPWKEVTFYQCKWTPLTENGGPTTAYTLLWFVVLFALPLATMSVSYSLIVYSVFKKSKELSSDKFSPNTSESCSSRSGNFFIEGRSSFYAQDLNLSSPLPRSSLTNALSDVHHLQQHRSAFLRQARYKSLQMSALIITAFAVSWTPYWVMFMLNAFPPFHVMENMKFHQILGEMSHWIFCFGMSNSVVNPIIYGAFHGQWCFRSSNHRHSSTRASKKLKRNVNLVSVGAESCKLNRINSNCANNVNRKPLICISWKMNESVARKSKQKNVGIPEDMIPPARRSCQNTKGRPLYSVRYKKSAHRHLATAI